VNASAEGLSGYLEYNYDTLMTKTTDATGEVSKSEAKNFLQTYNLLLNKRIMPNLTLDAGGFFQTGSSSSGPEGNTISSRDTTYRPRIGLKLDTPPFTTGVDYSKTVAQHTSAVTPTSTDIREDYNAVFFWRPSDFPTLNLLLSRSDFYDKERKFTDITTDQISVSSQYIPVQNLNLDAGISFGDIKDHLNDVETRTRFITGKASYNRTFIQRVFLDTTYTYSNSKTEFLAPVGSQILTQRIPLSGLFALSDTPTQVALAPNQALIDGNMTGGTGINIGLPSLIGGDITPWNIGLDFFDIDVEVNKLYVWVDRELPLSIVNSFSWSIYVSGNNLDWVLHATVSPATFGFLQNRFEIAFPNVKTRYIKVVTAPLTQIAAAQNPQFQNPDKIFVTELQAFLQSQATSEKITVSASSYLYTLDIRARLLDRPSLFYDFSYLTTPNRTFLSNGLSLTHRINPVFFSAGRVAREDEDVSQIRKTTRYLYSFTLSATPLPVLRHSLSYSGSTTSSNGRSSQNNMISLNNYALLYTGISSFLNGSMSFAKTDEGLDSRTTNATFGANLTPHKTLSVNLSYGVSKTEMSGSGVPERATSSRHENLSVAYQPFSTLYLFGSISRDAGEGRTRTTRNYGGNWSPFPDGTLQMNLSYAESIIMETNEENRTVTPSIRWNINRNARLETSYTMINSSSPSQETDLRSFNSNLSINF
jgi:hypothetical protein